MTGLIPTNQTKNMRKLLLLLCGITMLISQLQAQTRPITGKVTDEQGNPIPGTGGRDGADLSDFEGDDEQ